VVGGQAVNQNNQTINFTAVTTILEVDLFQWLNMYVTSRSYNVSLMSSCALLNDRLEQKDDVIS
jgi:hypothetical protein